MIGTALITVWLLGAAPAASDSVTLVYREAEPVIVAVRTQPAAPVAVDRYFQVKKIAVNALLIVTGAAALVLVAQKRASSRKNARVAPRPAPRTEEVASDRPDGETKTVQTRHARRDAHAAEIERLLKRI